MIVNQPSRIADVPGRNSAAGDAEFVAQLDAVLDELAAQSREVPERGAFYPLALNRLLLATQAEAVALWTPGPGGEWVPMYVRELEHPGRSARTAAIHPVREQLAQFATGDRSHAWLRGRAGDLVAVFQLRVLQQVSGILAVYRPAGESAALAESLLPLISAIVEILNDYEKNVALRDVENQLATQNALSTLVGELHASPTSTALAFTIANDARAFVGCDRISVFAVNGGVRHLASSGVSRVDRRSKYSRRLSDLIKKIAGRGRALAVPQGLTELPRRLRDQVESWVRDEGLASVFFIPLKSAAGNRGRARITGFYTVESFRQADLAPLLKKLGMVERHLAIAWENRWRVERNPLRGVGLLLAGLASQLRLDRLPRTAIVLLALAGLMLALLGIQREFRIELRGVLVPVARPHVWAPMDGIIRRVAVEHGSEVQVGQLLAELEAPDLDLELQRVEGELRTAQLRREGYRLSLQQAEMQRDKGEADQLKLSAEIAEIDAEIESLTAERQFLEELREKRSIVSPITGQIITWNVAELLANRPVRQGESLLIVGDTQGPWQIEFAVPDRMMKYIGEAQRQTGEPLSIDCLIAGDAHQPFVARLERIAQVATLANGGEPELTMEASVQREQVPQLRIGVSVTGRVRCGQRSLWYIGTYEFVDAIRRRFGW